MIFLKIYLNNQQNSAIWTTEMETELLRVAGAVLSAEHFDGPGEVSITLVDNATIQTLNNQYRHKNQPTDVLSFPADPQTISLPDGTSMTLLGDVIISFEQAAIQADEYGHSLLRETAFLLTHGLLHLAGYDHADPDQEGIMQQRTEELLCSLGIERDGIGS